MKRLVGRIGFSVLASALLLSPAFKAQKAGTPYPNMAPIDQYLMTDRNAEIALARTAAPKAISDNAEIMVLDREGYKTAVKGTNGFVCMVERAWTGGLDFTEFWNPKNRSPICFNPPAVRTYLPLTIAKTKLAFSGKSKAEIFDAIEAALDKKQLPTIEVGAMSYMMSKEGYLNDQAGHWHPHLMFFVPHVDAGNWGADLPGSPIFSDEEVPNRLTVFMVPVGQWSDGTPDSHKP
ncbi:MAG TPA: hypothetical protein VFJ47_03390 [Terriglobales bacterium]|nr:hypothetical protein [Terriglobales bacterium]